MIKPIPLDELEKDTDNIYEAICVTAKRARQINNEQKKILEEILTQYEEGRDEYEDDDLAREKLIKTINDLPKPISIAIKEKLRGEIEYSYLEPKSDE